MAKVCAIYGYEFTRAFTCRGMRFIPRYSWFTAVHEKARDLTRYHLTGVIILEAYIPQEIFNLEAVLSFIEHLDVIISDRITTDDSDFFALFPDVARIAERHSGGGAVLHQDTFFDDVRSEFVCLAMDRLSDKEFCERTGWNILFFKATEPFRQRRPFLEVSYFLLFSGLETYVRRTQEEADPKEVAVSIAMRLKKLGFNIHNYDPDDLKRSADTYARLRNALFHNSSLVATRRHKGGAVTYNLIDYYANFLILVNLVVLKAVNYEHQSIKWDAWITMQQ
jgi:hypothetical protein